MKERQTNVWVLLLAAVILFTPPPSLRDDLRSSQSVINFFFENGNFSQDYVCLDKTTDGRTEGE